MKLNELDILRATSNDILHIIIFPTESCNFRCVYCYETFKFGRMKSNVIEGIKNYLSKRIHELNYLSISWFGGEPLLALDIIEDISGYILSIINNFSDLIFHSHITTNGYLLTRNVFKKLIALKINHFQITFDGPQKIHDERRCLTNGEGTFDKIWNNLVNIKQIDDDYTINVRLHLDAYNNSYINDFIEKYRSYFINDIRFKLLLKPLRQLRCTNGSNIRVFSDNDSKENINKIGKLLKCLGLDFLTLDDMNYICYASDFNSFSIRANGNINKCTVFLENEKNQVGRINADGSLNIDKQKYLKWCRGYSSGNRDELSCPAKGI
jgi:uncharacterized protein